MHLEWNLFLPQLLLSTEFNYNWNIPVERNSVDRNENAKIMTIEYKKKNNILCTVALKKFNGNHDKNQANMLLTHGCVREKKGY